MGFRNFYLKLAIILVCLQGFFAEVTLCESVLIPDKEPIKFVDLIPEEETPQAAVVNFILLKEDGKFEEAGKFLSKDYAEWSRKSILKQDSLEEGPIRKDTLRYQLLECSPDKAKVDVSFNFESGTYNSWTPQLVREDGKWVIHW